MKIQLKNRPVLRDLGDGLILCRSTADDAEELGEFNSRIHSDDGFDKPDLRVAAWTRDLLARPHPTFKADDCTLVVEVDSGKIVSSMNLISQTWAYEGIAFPVGRPELVGTLPEYRKRGLVRAQFEEVHRWSAEKGELVQAITGIPFYYKLFGYEMGMELGGGRTGFEAQLPKLKTDETEPFHIRPAKEVDLPFLMEVYDHACQRRLITCVRDEALWRYDLSGQSRKNVCRLEMRIIERTGSKEKVGYLTHPWYDWDTGLIATSYELKPGVSWLEVTPTVARYLWQTGESYAARDGKPVVRTTYAFWFGSEHPSYDIFKEKLPRLRDAYAWYLRVPDLPGFLKHISLVLEKRVAASAIVGYSGEVKISFYHSGLRMELEKGSLKTIEDWMPAPGDVGNAAFPDLSFLQMVFGYRSIEELEQSYADCWYTGDEARGFVKHPLPAQGFFGDDGELTADPDSPAISLRVIACPVPSNSLGVGGSGGCESNWVLEMKTFLRSFAHQFQSLNRPARLFLVALFFDGLLFSGYSLFFNLYIIESGFSREFLGLINAAPSISALLLGVPMGLLSDRIGRKRSMIIGFALANLAIIGMLLTHDMTLIFILGLAWGATGQLYFLSHAPFMMKVSDDKSRDVLFSFSFGMFPLASTLGSFLAGYLPGVFRDSFGITSNAAAYQAVLLFCVIGSFIALVPIALIREQKKTAVEKTDVAGAGRTSVWKVLFRPLTVKLSLPNLVIGFGAATLVPYFNVFFSERHQMSDSVLGLLFSVGSLITGIGCILGPRLVGNLGGKIRTIVIAQTASLGFLLMIGFSPWAWMAVIGFLARGALMNMVAPLFDAYSLELTAEHEHGAVNSIRNLAWNVGWAVGPYISGVVQGRWGFTPLFISTAILYAVAIGLTWIFFRPKAARTLVPVAIAEHELPPA